jgi:hypothetical protein
MREWQSISHVRWYCRYHIIIVPKRISKTILSGTCVWMPLYFGGDNRAILPAARIQKNFYRHSHFWGNSMKRVFATAI